MESGHRVHLNGPASPHPGGPSILSALQRHQQPLLHVSDNHLCRLLDVVDGRYRARERLRQRETERARAAARFAEISAVERAQSEVVGEDVLVEALEEILRALESEDPELQRETLQLQSVVVRAELTIE